MMRSHLAASRRPRRTPLLALCALSALGAAAVGTGAVANASAPPQPPVTVLDAGDGEPVTIPPPYAVGQAATSSTSFTVDVDIDGEQQSTTLQLDLGLSVAELTADGGAVVNSTINGLHSDAGSLGTVDDVVGVTIAQTVSASGQTLSSELVDDGQLTAAQREGAATVMESVNSTTFAFPETPIAVGATWETQQSVDASGIAIPATYHFRLRSVDAEHYTVDVTFDAAIDTDVGGAHVSGTIDGKGTIEGSVDNPLLVDYRMQEVADLSSDDGTSLHMQIVIAATATPA